MGVKSRPWIQSWILGDDRIALAAEMLEVCIQRALLTHQKSFNPKSAASSGYPSASLSLQGFFCTSSCEQADNIQIVSLLSCVRIKSTGTSEKINSPLLAELTCGGWGLALAGLDSERREREAFFWTEKKKQEFYLKLPTTCLLWDFLVSAASSSIVQESRQLWRSIRSHRLKSLYMK